MRSNVKRSLFCQETQLRSLPLVCIYFLLLSISGGRASANAASTAMTLVPEIQGRMETPFMPAYSGKLAPNGEMFLYGDTDIFHSDNGGETWSAETNPAYWAPKRSLAISPDYPADQTLFLGLDYGDDAFLISTDGGHSWNSPLQELIGPISDIAVSPEYAADQTIFVSTTSSSGNHLY